MDINTSRKNLLAHLHLLPAPVQADVKFLLEKFDAAVRELEELNRNMAVQNKVEDLPHEIWRDIDGYEGIYMVSNMGRVKSFYGIGEMLLTPSANRGGYMYVVLTKDKVRKSRKVHTLVGRAFLPNPENKPLVHHRDTNRGNNLLSNLKWATHQENSDYAAQMGSYAKEKGCASPKAKLTEEQVRYIRENYVPRHREFGANALARKFNVCTNTISSLVNYRTYQDIM